MKLREKIYYSIAAGWAGLLLAYGSCKLIHTKNNHAGIAFMENGKISSGEFTTKEPCSVTIKAYGHDYDGISSFELRVDGETYASSPSVGGYVDYSFTTELCNLTPGEHMLEAIITDNDGNRETGEGLLTVEGHRNYI